MNRLCGQRVIWRVCGNGLWPFSCVKWSMFKTLKSRPQLGKTIQSKTVHLFSEHVKIFWLHIPCSTWTRELPDATAVGIPRRRASKTKRTTQGIIFTDFSPLRKKDRFLAYTSRGSKLIPCWFASSRIISLPGTPARAKKLSLSNFKPVSLQIAHQAFQCKGIVSSNVPSQSNISPLTSAGNGIPRKCCWEKNKQLSNKSKHFPPKSSQRSLHVLRRKLKTLGLGLSCAILSTCPSKYINNFLRFSDQDFLSQNVKCYHELRCKRG